MAAEKRRTEEPGSGKQGQFTSGLPCLIHPLPRARLSIIKVGILRINLCDREGLLQALA